MFCLNNTSTNLPVVLTIEKIRFHTIAHLPFSLSHIRELIVFRLMKAYIDGSEITVKVIFADLQSCNYSTMGIRHHFNKLLYENWIEVKRSSKDRRAKIVLPSKKLLGQLELLAFDIKTLLAMETE